IPANVGARRRDEPFAMIKRSVDSPTFLIFSLSLGTLGLASLLVLSTTIPLSAEILPKVLLLSAIALTMRLNRFTIPPTIVVSLVYTVQLAAVILLEGPLAAWISVGTFLIATLARRPAHVAPRIFLAVVSFNIGMEALMTLIAGAVFRMEAM